MQEINQISWVGRWASSICAVFCFCVPLVIALDLVFSIMNVAFLDVIGKIIIKKKIKIQRNSDDCNSKLENDNFELVWKNV